MTDSRQIVINEFENKYRKEPYGVSFTPYRVCPIGAHSDHNLGRITGFAIDRGVYIAYGPKQNGIIEISSLQFEKRAQWHVRATPEVKQGDWADHLRGATIALNKRYPLSVGLCAVINGELPIGGLSSSAAVIITFLSSLCKLNGIRLSASELIEVSREAENRYVGVASGKLDQSCEIYCRKDSLLYMDMLDDSHEIIPVDPSAKPFKIMIFFSGLERTLAATTFNNRVDEAKAAAYAVSAFNGKVEKSFSAITLRDVPREVYEEYKNRLPDNWRKRAEHWYTEQQRVIDGVKAWKAGNVELYGKYCTESGRSSIVNWETGSPELIKLYESARTAEGVYGTRFSGAGFKGCVMALIDPSFSESIGAKVRKEYLSEFPLLTDKYSDCVCSTSDGILLD